MFSQWRHAVESLAQPVVKSAGSDDASTDSTAIRTSLSSSSQLAESALTNLKKSIVIGRTTSPSTATGPAEPPPRPHAGRTTLEERLRAKFAIGEESNNTTPASSIRASPSPAPSPSPVPVTEHPLALDTAPSDIPEVKGEQNHPLSPTSALLPDSPVVSPIIEAPQPLAFLAENIVATVASGDAPPATEEHPQVVAEPLAGPVTPEKEDAPLEPLPPASDDGVRESLTVTEPGEGPLNAPTPPPPSPPSKQDIAKEHDEPAKQEHPQGDIPRPLSPVLHNPAPPNDAPPSPTPARPLADDAPPAPLPNGDALRTEPAAPHSGHHLAPTPERPLTPSFHDSNDVEALQKRLRLVEQRFADVSTSFKRLQAEKLAADRVLRELTSVETVVDVEALRNYLQNMDLKAEMAQDEIRRLTGKLTRQDERIEELRDIHRLESKSQSDQIERLKAQMDEAEKLLKASQGSATQIEEEAAKWKTKMEQMQAELNKATSTAKEEEEKRVKAVALLKTVREKLVKLQKEKDDASKEVATLRDAERTLREKEKAERDRLHAEIDKVNVERETAVKGLKAQFDREVAGLKERQERELSALKGQYELEALSMKTIHTKEVEKIKGRVSELDSRVKVLTEERDELFDQLHLRQAELESSHSLQESLTGQNTELQYQLREANDRIALLSEEFSDVRREQDVRIQAPGPSAEEISRLIAAAETKQEAKLVDLRRRLADVERERDEGEAHWSKKLAERTREVEALKATVNSSQKSRDEESESADALKAEIESLRAEIRAHQRQLSDLRSQIDKSAEVELAAKSQLAELSTKAADLQQSVEEGQSREAQLRAVNKTLREELRKVQSSAALLEKQRNPGVGYWAAKSGSSADLRSPRSSVSDLPSQETSSRPSSPSTVKSDEEVNLEYLRNVIIQFLEHKEMRPHLVRILSTILRFTPQETRRVISKV